MANAHSKPEGLVSQRQYTVGYVPNGGKPNPIPAINLKGKWLEQAGFTQGTPIVVTIIGEHILITTQPRRSLMNEVLREFR
jgi:toxic protein SymE